MLFELHLTCVCWRRRSVHLAATKRGDSVLHDLQACGHTAWETAEVVPACMSPDGDWLQRRRGRPIDWHNDTCLHRHGEPLRRYYAVVGLACNTGELQPS